MTNDEKISALQDQLGKILLELKVYGALQDGRRKRAEQALKESGYTCYDYNIEPTI